MTEIIEPEFDLAAQEARDLARRATPEPAIQADMTEQPDAGKPAADQAEGGAAAADIQADTGKPKRGRKKRTEPDPEAVQVHPEEPTQAV